MTRPLGLCQSLTGNPNFLLVYTSIYLLNLWSCNVFLISISLCIPSQLWGQLTFHGCVIFKRESTILEYSKIFNPTVTQQHCVVQKHIHVSFVLSFLSNPVQFRIISTLFSQLKDPSSCIRALFGKKSLEKPIGSFSLDGLLNPFTQASTLEYACILVPPKDNLSHTKVSV